MEQSFRLNSTYRWVVLLLMPGVTLGFIYVLYTTATDAKSLGGDIASILAEASAMWIVIIIVIIDSLRYKIICADDTIRKISLRGSIELKYSAIKGYSKVPKGYLTIYPLDTNEKELKIDGRLEHKKEFEKLLRSKIKDLDELERFIEEKALLLDDRLGKTENERAATIKKRKRIAITLNTIGMIVSIAFWLDSVFPSSIFSILFLLTLFMPAVAVAILAKYNGFAKVLTSMTSVRPSVAGTMIVPCGVLAFIASDNRVASYQNFWVPFSIVAAFFLAACLLIGKDEKEENASRYANLFVMLMCAIGYAYGSVLIANCHYDTGAKKMYKVTVLGNRTKTGKYTSYYLTLDKWGAHDSEEERVDEDLYHEKHVGESVTVTESEGRLNISWYTLGE